MLHFRPPFKQKKLWATSDEMVTDFGGKPADDKSKQVDQTEGESSPISAFRKSWHKWSEGSTLHGIKFVFDRDSLTVRRILWLLILGAACYGLASAILVQVHRYRLYKTVTKTTVVFEDTLLFPAVTICSLNLIRNSSVTDPEVRDLLKTMYFTGPKNGSSLEEQFDEQFLESVDLGEIFDNGYSPYTENFLMCYVASSPTANCSTHLTKRKTDYGTCYTLNAALSVNGTDERLETRLSGPDNGIMLTLWVDQDNYFIGDEASAGFKVLVHDQNDEPVMRDLATSVGPGHTYYMAITKRETCYLPHPVKAFGQRECKDIHPDTFKNPLQFYRKYSYNACVRECRSMYINEQCGCVSAFDPGNFTVCRPHVYSCYLEAYHNFSYLFELDSCNCPLPCNKTDFITKVSSAYFPNSNFLKLAPEVTNYTQEQIRDNALQLRIYFESKVVEKHEQLLEYTPEDLQGDIGGYLSLAIGASVITFLEILELIVTSAFRCCLRRSRRT